MSRLTGDFLRILSIIAVLSIHATHADEVSFNQHHDFFSTAFLGALLNQIARFSVPVFLLLSGYGLTKKYGDVSPRAINFSWAWNFYKKRYLKIGIPFFFWTVAVLLFFNKFVFAGSAVEILKTNLMILFKYLFVQGADYHFYFFTIILECYLLYPLLLKYRGALLLSIIAFVHLLYIFPAAVNEFTGITLYRFPSSFSVYWLFYFYAGILSADVKMEARIKSMPLLPLIFTALIAMMFVVYEYTGRSFNESNPDFYNHFNRLSVLLYSLLVWAAFIRMDIHLENLIKSRNLIGFTGVLAGLSFGVYIYHTMLLRMLNQIMPGGLLLIVPSVIAASFALMMILDRMVTVNSLRIIIGLPDRNTKK